MMTWQDIHGWFDYSDLYQRIASTLYDGARFCEVGVWLGRSLAAMASYCEGLDVKLYAVDTFCGSTTGTCPDVQRKILAECEGSLLATFKLNMRACGVTNLRIIPAFSQIAATKFRDGYFDACFIDADHSFDAVSADIRSWLPKIKSGGMLAGHDYDRLEVRAAVDLHLGKDFERIGNCWAHIVK